MYLTKFAAKLYATNVRCIRWASLLKVSKWDSISSNSIMKQLKRRDSDSFCDRNMSCFYQLFHHTTCMPAFARSLLMSQRNIIFYLFSLTYLVRWEPNMHAPEISPACAALHESRRRFHVNMGFSDDDRILAVTSNICCNIATGTCLI